MYIVVFDVKQCVVLNPKKPNSIIVHGNQDVKNVLYKLEVCLAYSYRNEKKLWKKYDYGKEGWAMSTLNHCII